MDLDLQEDEDIARVKADSRVIAVVGMSSNEARPSWGVARYLQSQGYRIIPVNPGHSGSELLGEKVYSHLADIPKSEKVDMVDIFRRSDAVGGIVDEALANLPYLKTIWLQLGVIDDAAAQKARAKGITFIQDRCPKIEFPRF